MVPVGLSVMRAVCDGICLLNSSVGCASGQIPSSFEDCLSKTFYRASFDVCFASVLFLASRFGSETVDPRSTWVIVRIGTDDF